MLGKCNPYIATHGKVHKILDESIYRTGGHLLQVEFLTGQVAGAQSELSRREDATQLLGESEQARREVMPAFFFFQELRF